MNRRRKKTLQSHHVPGLTAGAEGGALSRANSADIHIHTHTGAHKYTTHTSPNALRSLTRIRHRR